MSEVPRVPEVAVRPSPGGLRLRAVLEGERPFQGEARVGAAFISEADRLTWEEAKREGGGGAGPSRLEDLANVAEWRPATVTPSASGGTLGPEPVPVAPRYRLLAWEPDGTFWWGDVVPEAGALERRPTAAVPATGGVAGRLSSDAPASRVVDAGVLRARRPTGVRVRLAGTRPEHGPFFVRVERIVDVDPRGAERASELLPVVRHVAPNVAAALSEGTPLPLSANGDTALLPLPMDPAVRLWLRSASGQEGAPVEVPLREGRVETVVLDVHALFPGGVGSTVTLRGRVVLEGSATAPPGARLVGPDGQDVALTPEGRFTVEALPSWSPSRFTVQVVPSGSGRPLAPEWQAFEFSPKAGVSDAAVTWRVPVYRWLVLRMDGHARALLQERSRRPYPVFVLQRRGTEGRWLTHSAEVFHEEERGMAVSLLEAGTYRVLAATSPYEVHASTSAEVSADGAERFVTLRMDEGGVACEVRVTSAGAPVYGAYVTSTGVLGSLPPARGRTDAEGRWRLGRVLADSLHVEVEAEGHAPWMGEAVSECHTSGVVEVRL
ncbi:carboxypeptidase-like regulatory domain-containing protein [Pyxidicoccus xibeiensis]|uniref:carboxypeptidase-like regulatory domain-containing protein n=1 Tax=Pyxidicoccus xibeiensis TaxID=2906759 RepID=UPI0020A71DB1|nr:carboxypeptidase-like regulatory domain-containing protein [Pyxidicoccus xibeiensis]MCP3139754.1 carboxypeptidase-like regulatory domain-containing protein [Pyxidicoccus xibeiensis]